MNTGCSSTTGRTPLKLSNINKEVTRSACLHQFLVLSSKETFTLWEWASFSWFSLDISLPTWQPHHAPARTWLKHFVLPLSSVGRSDVPLTYQKSRASGPFQHEELFLHQEREIVVAKISSKLTTSKTDWSRDICRASSSTRGKASVHGWAAQWETLASTWWLISGLATTEYSTLLFSAAGAD